MKNYELAKIVNWNDIRIFLAVAQAGGLTGAAGKLNGSPATLGRHITRLEEAMGQNLFIRSATGYALSDAGQELFAEVKPMEVAALGVERWREERTGTRTVRVSAGSWTSWFLARHMHKLQQPGDAFRLAFVSAEERLDIARRHADIGIRNARPVEIGLAGRTVGDVAFAAYRKVGASPQGWIASASSTPSARWVRVNHGDHIAVEANTARVAMDLCEAGAGKAVLPCFVGDQNGILERVGGLIETLTHRQWLVAHHETRNQTAIRTILNRIGKLIDDNKVLIAGEVGHDTP